METSTSSKSTLIVAAPRQERVAERLTARGILIRIASRSGPGSIGTESPGAAQRWMRVLTYFPDLAVPEAVATSASQVP